MIMDAARARWILGFDGTCGSCAGVADAVSACGDRLEVLPLQNEAVREWRHSALGDDAAWVPVLLAVSDDAGVQAWTGVRLVGRLVGRWGVRGSFRVLRTLGRLRAMNRRGEVRRPGDLGPLRELSRAHLVRDVGLGAVTVMGMAVKGAAPAATDTVGGWERAMEGSLPTTLPELAALPGVYRRVAYTHMTSEQRSAGWTARLDGFSAVVAVAGPSEQAAVARAQSYARDPSRFVEADLALLDDITDDVVTAFGRDRAREMIAVLGDDEDDADAVSCACSVSSDFCSGGRRCRLNLQGCTTSPSGCGSFYSYSCNGLCA